VADQLWLMTRVREEEVVMSVCRMVGLVMMLS